MSEIAKRDYSIAVSKCVKLTKGQLALYETLDEAYQKKQIITRAVIENLYQNFVEKSLDTYNPWKEQFKQKDGTTSYRGGYQPKNDWQRKQSALMWFTLSLGALIRKGYLTAIPKFNLSDVKTMNKEGR